MTQLDITGGMQQEAPARPVRNTRPVVADEKATLALQLGRLCTKVPMSVRSGSVQLTRDWTAAQKQGMKLLRSSTASVNQLRSAISAMERFA